MLRRNENEKKPGGELGDEPCAAGEAVSVVWSATSDAGRVVPIRIECAFGRGFAGIVMIGGVGQICEDGKERAKAALERLGWSMPARKILISVSPGDAKIDRPHLDLALCVALAGVTGGSEWRMHPAQWLFAAEIGLNGEMRPVPGVVAWATAAMESGLKGIVVAAQNLAELECLRSIGGGIGSDFACLGFLNLKDVIEWLAGTDGNFAEQASRNMAAIEGESGQLDFDDMELGPDLFVLACVVAAGSHSLLMRGSPGTGKSMFAKRIKSILPTMTPPQQLRALRIHSAATAAVSADILEGRPPFRAPHHYTSLAAMVGTSDLPGEISLASGGILFLDELPEFRRDVLEGLREPLESREVAVSRARGRQTWCADVLLIAAANNCPCGWTASRRRRCDCPPARVSAYRSRLSGPLQDRIDIHLNMPEPLNQLGSILTRSVERKGQTARLRDLVSRARQMAVSRLGVTGVQLNKDISPENLFDAFKLPHAQAMDLVTRVIPHFATARSLVRCLRVARTVADVLGDDVVNQDHLSRAWGWQAPSAAMSRGECTPI